MSRALVHVASTVASHTCAFRPEVGKTESTKDAYVKKWSFPAYRLFDFADLYSTAQVCDATKE